MKKDNTLTILGKNFLYYNTPSNRSGELSIFGVGREKCYVGKMEGPKYFPHYSMHIVLNGKGTIIINKEKYEVTANQIFLLPADKEIIYYPDDNDPWEYIWCNFKGPRAVDLCLRCNLTLTTPIFTSVTPEIIKVAKSITKLYSKKYSLDVAILGKFYELFALMIEQICTDHAHATSAKEEYVFKAITYINENYVNPKLSLKQVSEHVHLHFNYFSQIFKKVTGSTFNYYLNLFRVQRACQLLITEKKAVNEIAEEVGFFDPLYFSKVFKKYMGCSPKHYASSNLKQ